MKNIEIREMHGFWQNFKGLMGTQNINYAIKIRCNGIHTFFMKEPIDIIATDKNGNILHIWHNVKPWKIIMPKKNVYYTYEFPINVINFKIGDKLK